MKVSEIIAQIDKSPELAEQVYIAEIAENVFDLNIQYWEEQNRLVSYYMACWHCTDSTVGYKAYFLDDKLVAVSEQEGRKCHENFKWINKEAYYEVKDFILSFDEDNKDFTPEIIDLNDDWGDSFKIVYYEQMYSFHKKNATYKGEPVEIVGFKNSGNVDGEYVAEQCEIKYPNGLASLFVPTDQLDFRYNLTKKNC